MQNIFFYHICFASTRVADAVCIWLKTSKAEVIKDQSFLKLLANLQDSLEKDGMKLQLTSLSTYLAESMKSASSSSSMAMTPSASGGHSQFSFLKVCELNILTYLNTLSCYFLPLLLSLLAPFLGCYTCGF